MTRLAFLTRGASAVMTYELVAKVKPGGFEHGLTGLMSTVIEVFPVTSKAPGRNPITTWPSSVNAEFASLTPLMTLITRWPDIGGRLPETCTGGQTQLYGCCGVNPATKARDNIHAANQEAPTEVEGRTHPCKPTWCCLPGRRL